MWKKSCWSLKFKAKVFRDKYQKFKEVFLHRILHVEDTPHRIALGAAAGIFIAWTPTFGLQTILAIALAALIRGNKAAAVPMVWITNPLSNPAIYGISYFVGHFLCTGNWTIDADIKRQLIDLMNETMVLDIWNASFWSRLMDISLRIGLELWIGCCVMGLALAIITYPVIRQAVIGYRHHKELKKLKKEHECQL